MPTSQNFHSQYNKYFTTCRRSESYQCSPRPPPNLFKIHFNIIFPPTPSSSKCPLSLKFAHQSPVCIFPLPHTYHMLHPYQPSWYCLPNILWKIQIMKLLIMPAISSGPHLGLIIFLSPLFSNTLSLCSSRNIRDQVSHSHKTTGKIIVLWKIGRQKILDRMTAFQNKLDITWSEVMRNKSPD